MQQDEVLAQLAAAREGAAQAIAHIEESGARTQEVVQLASERLAQLTESFDELRAHLKSEASRAADAAASVLDAFAHSEAWAIGATATHNQALLQISHRSEASRSAHEQGSETIGRHGEAATERRASSIALFEELLQQINEGHSSHSEALANLKTRIGDWTSETDEVSRQQNESVRGLIEQDLDRTRSEFEQNLATRVEKAGQELETRQQELEQHTQEEVAKLTQEENEQRDQVFQGVEGMLDALTKFGELVNSTSGTMVKGAEQAGDLVDVACTGIDVVIGLFENLSQIFDEIEDAWRD